MGLRTIQELHSRLRISLNFSQSLSLAADNQANQSGIQTQRLGIVVSRTTTSSRRWGSFVVRPGGRWGVRISTPARTRGERPLSIASIIFGPVVAATLIPVRVIIVAENFTAPGRAAGGRAGPSIRSRITVVVAWRACNKRSHWSAKCDLQVAVKTGVVLHTSLGVAVRREPLLCSKSTRLCDCISNTDGARVYRLNSADIELAGCVWMRELRNLEPRSIARRDAQGRRRLESRKATGLSSWLRGG